MSYIGSKPANKPVVASDLDPTVITGQTALAASPADTDEFLISDAGVLKRLDASLIGGGKVLQVVSQQYTTPITVSGVTQTYKDAAISAAITPSSTSSKVFAWFNLSVANTTSSGNRVRIKLVRDSTDIGIGTGSTGNRQAATVSALYENNDQYETQTIPVMWLDTPSSTSATTYKIQVCSNNNTSQNLFFNRGTGDVDNTDHVRTVSQVLLIEIGE